ncbi:MAG: hypothetical protein DI547_01940 [Sphingobium sp.]|nr:MAG: hypothetical protein DI547_01940 [Sphingobium sp.]
MGQNAIRTERDETPPGSLRRAMRAARRPLLGIALLALSAGPLLLITRMPVDPAMSDGSASAAAGLTVSDLGHGRGVVVTSVMTDGPAERAGVVAGDRLMAIGGRRPQDERAAIRQLDDIGCRVTLDVLRDRTHLVTRLDRCRGSETYGQDTGR